MKKNYFAKKELLSAKNKKAGLVVAKTSNPKESVFNSVKFRRMDSKYLKRRGNDGD